MSQDPRDRREPEEAPQKPLPQDDNLPAEAEMDDTHDDAPQPDHGDIPLDKKIRAI